MLYNVYCILPPNKQSVVQVPVARWRPSSKTRSKAAALSLLAAADQQSGRETPPALAAWHQLGGDDVAKTGENNVLGEHVL